MTSQSFQPLQKKCHFSTKLTSWMAKALHWSLSVPEHLSTTVKSYLNQQVREFMVLFRRNLSMRVVRQCSWYIKSELAQIVLWTQFSVYFPGLDLLLMFFTRLLQCVAWIRWVWVCSFSTNPFARLHLPLHLQSSTLIPCSLHLRS